MQKLLFNMSRQTGGSRRQKEDTYELENRL